MAASDRHTDEPDRLAGFPAPREVARLFGHEAPRAEFLSTLESGRLHHAWLLAGPEGIGKATLAYGLARQLLARSEAGREAADPDDPDTPLFVQVAGRAHPNLLALNRTYNDKTKRYSQVIGVEDVRRMRHFLGGTASRPGWRVVIVDRADELNQNAANALLKALEEPPEKTVFFLIAAAEGRIPVTIRSRCRVLRMHPLAGADLAAAVGAALAASELEAAPKDLQAALLLSEGSVRAALTLASGEGIGIYREIIGAFKRLPGLDQGWLHGQAERLSNPANADRFELFFSLLLTLVERLVRIAGTGQGGTEDERAIAGRLISHQSLGAWADGWARIDRLRREVLGLNLDKGLLVIESFAILQQLASGRAAA